MSVRTNERDSSTLRIDPDRSTTQAAAGWVSGCVAAWLLLVAAAHLPRALGADATVQRQPASLAAMAQEVRRFPATVSTHLSIADAVARTTSGRDEAMRMLASEQEHEVVFALRALGEAGTFAVLPRVIEVGRASESRLVRERAHGAVSMLLGPDALVHATGKPSPTLDDCLAQIRERQVAFTDAGYVAYWAELLRQTEREPWDESVQTLLWAVAVQRLAGARDVVGAQRELAAAKARLQLHPDPERDATLARTLAAIDVAELVERIRRGEVSLTDLLVDMAAASHPLDYARRCRALFIATDGRIDLPVLPSVWMSPVTDHDPLTDVLDPRHLRVESLGLRQLATHIAESGRQR
jgi:hypothetical protein